MRVGWMAESLCFFYAAQAESDDGLAWIYTLLRFNVMKLVGISRRSNYQSKDLAHTQKTGEEAAARHDLAPVRRIRNWWMFFCLSQDRPQTRQYALCAT